MEELLNMIDCMMFIWTNRNESYAKWNIVIALYLPAEFCGMREYIEQHRNAKRVNKDMHMHIQKQTKDMLSTKKSESNSTQSCKIKIKSQNIFLVITILWIIEVEL